MLWLMDAGAHLQNADFVYLGGAGIADEW
jgi:hypothetical protein